MAVGDWPRPKGSAHPSTSGCFPPLGFLSVRHRQHRTQRARTRPGAGGRCRDEIGNGVRSTTLLAAGSGREGHSPASRPTSRRERPMIGGGVLSCPAGSVQVTRIYGPLRFPEPDGTIRMLFPPEPKPLPAGPASGRTAEDGASAIPPQSQPGRPGRFPSRTFRRDSRTPLSGKIRPTNLEGPP